MSHHVWKTSSDTPLYEWLLNEESHVTGSDFFVQRIHDSHTLFCRTKSNSVIVRVKSFNIKYVVYQIRREINYMSDIVEVVMTFENDIGYIKILFNDNKTEFIKLSSFNDAIAKLTSSIEGPEVLYNNKLFKLYDQFELDLYGVNNTLVLVKDGEQLKRFDYMKYLREKYTHIVNTEENEYQSLKLNDDGIEINVYILRYGPKKTYTYIIKYDDILGMLEKSQVVK